MQLPARHLGVSALIALTAAMTPLDGRAATPRFRAEVLGGDPAVYVQPYGMNNLGQVVGKTSINGKPGNFIYDHGQVRPLQGLHPLSSV